MQKIDTTNPWQTLNETTVYDNNWIDVSHHNIINPTGGKGIYGVVHFKNVAIGILPLDEHYNTWLVGQYRYTLNQYSWEIPEGGGLIGTDPLENAQRELVEETGIIASRWTKILDLHTSNSVTDEYGVAYLAQDLSYGASSPEDTEQLQIRKLPFTEVFQMVLDGTITDALSMLTIFKVKWMIDNQQL
ncbi:MAG: NUDIX hydrolase [Saprospiraceae bacterium]|nr:NUDIX hydrolase [Saprospiraceae bacterium]MBP7699353.1 NUDIX hydrolase [Saprospiraceae bacterium]